MSQSLTSEFDLIARCFDRPTRHTLLGVGDDGALIRPSTGCELVISTDLLVEGTHFFADGDPELLGWKTLAVNVSDLAAMGAVPRWATLGAVLPAPTFSWLDPFARGFFACAERYGIDLIGGDTTRGPSGAMTFGVTIIGEVPSGKALLRSGAGLGDTIWVSGAPGRAALGLAHLQGRMTLAADQLVDCLAALHHPIPRLELGIALRNFATAAIDVSDGLLADLGHIVESSRASAVLRIPDLPEAGLARQMYLAGGDDYELVFTVPSNRTSEIEQLGHTLGLALTCIGVIEAGAPGTVVVLDRDGRDITPDRRGFDHFA